MYSVDGILGKSFALNVAALDGLAQRQQLHTQNLANIDTAGYHAKTVDFESVLGSAMQSDGTGGAPGGSMQGGSGMEDARTAGDFTSKFAVSESGKAGVNRSTEVSQMMNDNIKFRVITQQVTNQLSAVRSVIAEMGRG